MFRRLLEQRTVIAMLIATGVGALGVHAYPIDRGNVYLQLIELRSPAVFLVLVYGYATLWFTTPFFTLSIVTSLATIVAYRYPVSERARPLPAYVPPERRPSPTLVLGETHFETTTGRAPAPSWLTIPQRGLYTGVMIVGAVGTGKTSACMYPYAEQLLRWRADDPDRKIGGLVLEVKGDFCRQVRGMLSRAGRESDYAEIRLGGDICYNPLHNDLDPYAVAFAIATLVNNLFGKSKEPFWQQAYTDLLKFVILLRRLVDGYTTFAEVYRYILEDTKIESEISALKTTLESAARGHRGAPGELRASGRRTFRGRTGSRMARDTWRTSTAPIWNLRYTSTRFRSRCDERKGQRGSNANTSSTPSTGGLRTAGVVSITGSAPPSPKESSCFSRCSTRTWQFIGRSAHREARTPSPPKPGEPRPLEPLEELLESGHVLALNFPVGLNPGLARALGVMLKLDFQRAVLQRIPKIAAHPERTWRDLLFVCDEYHAFATVGETDPTGDERTFALSRQARLIPIVATQSVSSLRSALPGDESWRTLLQCFRTKLFLATSDEFTARAAADLCGRRDRLKAHYTLSEGGQGAHISLLTGRATAAKQTVSASKSYAPHHEYIFSPRVFTELQNAQAIALPYDGLNPMRPQFCYLKPHYLDVQTSYFDHVARGAL